MTVSLKEYAVVGYLSTEDAEKALEAALKRFKQHRIPSRELSHCDGNVVLLHAESPAEKARMKRFLLNQHGAQPEGCYCK